MVYMTILSYYVLDKGETVTNVTIMDIRRQCIKIWNFFKTKWL